MPLISAPNPTNLSLGKGKLFIKRRDAITGADTGFRHAGNCDKFTTKATVDVIDNMSSMDPTAGIYAEIPKSTKVEITIEGFEYDPNNVALMLYGDSTPYSQASSSPVDVQFAAAATVVLDGYYEVGARNPTITNIKQGATTLTLGTDYEITDPNVGMIHLLPTGAAVAGTALTWSGSVPAIASTLGNKLITIASSPQIPATVRFLPAPKHGPNLDVTLWSVNMTPNGEPEFISDALAKIALKGTVQLDAAGLFGGSAASPYGQVIVWQN